MLLLRRYGFTLPEMIIVVAGIFVLSFAVFFVSSRSSAQARDAQRVSHIQQLQAGLERYFHDHDRYPDGDGLVLGAGLARCLDEDGFVPACDEGGVTYLSVVPADPADGQYVYTAPEGLTYQVAFSLERALANLPAGPHAADPEGIR